MCGEEKPTAVCITEEIIEAARGMNLNNRIANLEKTLHPKECPSCSLPRSEEEKRTESRSSSIRAPVRVYLTSQR